MSYFVRIGLYCEAVSKQGIATPYRHPTHRAGETPHFLRCLYCATIILAGDDSYLVRLNM